MQVRKLAGYVVCLGAVIAAAAVVAQQPASASIPSRAPARAWTPARTPWGHPDLQGTWTNFDSTPFEQPIGGWTGKPRSAAGAGGVGVGYDQDWVNSPISPLRPSMVVDPPNGRVPVRPEAEAVREDNLAHRNDNWVYQSPWERCITRGVPGGMFPSNYNNALEIVQTPEHVVIHQEMIHEVRIIPMDGRPRLDPSVRQWMGDARGRWEGNTLIVETTNFDDRAWIANNVATERIRGIPVSEALHLTERFTRVAENTINYEVTIVDPKIYTAHWKVAMPLNLDPGYRIFEYACHEGNLQMPHSLSTGRAVDREREEAAKEKK